uniref:Hepatocyte growth factor-regulated tyrosine kinase substrate n=1 Tax=Steinernema glaseri TaxID=37863 RepID=A0A1I8AAU8_9BILA
MGLFSKKKDGKEAESMGKRFEKTLDRATDCTLLEPDWNAILEFVDAIRSGDVPVKCALTAIQKRLLSDNPNKVHLVLIVLEACVKNCGEPFHREVATRAFMDGLRELAFDSRSKKVSHKTLELIQAWAIGLPQYQIFVDSYNYLKHAGLQFPPVNTADALFSSQSAPKLADGSECFRCRAHFSVLRRKHNCRACGQVFCDSCSHHQISLPDFGIERKVRVCERCFEERRPQQNGMGNYGEDQEISRALALSRMDVQRSRLGPAPPANCAEDEEQLARALWLSRLEASDNIRPREESIIKDDDLAKAIELSKLEAEKGQKQREMLQRYNGPENSCSMSTISGIPESPSILDRPWTLKCDPIEEEPLDPELARFLNKDYWSKAGGEPKVAESEAPRKKVEDVDIKDTTALCEEMEERVARMENRIRSNMSRGRSILNDAELHRSFTGILEKYHTEVIKKKIDLEKEREHYEGLQDRVADITEARQAINALREDYAQVKREQQLAEQRERQRQMQEKLQLMRTKKQEMLLQQRHEALLKFQQHEAYRLYPQNLGLATTSQMYPPVNTFAPPLGNPAPQATGFYQASKFPVSKQNATSMHGHPSVEIPKRSFAQEPIAPSPSLDSVVSQVIPEKYQVAKDENASEKETKPHEKGVEVEPLLISLD